MPTSQPRVHDRTKFFFFLLLYYIYKFIIRIVHKAYIIKSCFFGVSVSQAIKFRDCARPVESNCCTIALCHQTTLQLL